LVVAFHLTPDPGDPGEQQVRQGHLGGDFDERRRLVRDGAQLLAHGALICPRCALPLAIKARVRAGLDIRCAYCDHTAPAREFLREDVFDTLENEVYLVARVS
jgi:uncharacterized Zn finger protein (UPF0148 family)